jgi:hypothetical protein
MVPYHLVSDAKAITVFQADAGVFTCHYVRRVDPITDIAVLVLDSASQIGASFAHLADSRLVKKGDTAYVLHNSLYGDKVEYKTTIVEAGFARQMPENYLKTFCKPELPMLELSGPFDSGSAGGLVLNANYDLIGVILSGETNGSPRTVVALASGAIQPLMNGTYSDTLEGLKTPSTSDAAFYNQFLGTSPQQLDYNAPMTEGYIAWFTPMQPVGFKDKEFTTEISDKIAKNWFCTTNLLIDNRPIREWSANRLVVLPAAVNPWNMSDGEGRLIHFDADSKFTKVVHKERTTEERIMTRNLLAVALPAGTHKVQYENKGANYKSTGIVRKSIKVEQARTTLLDITGLSLVTLKLLPKKAAAVGEQQSVHYEVERKPIGEREVGLMIRLNRFPQSFKQS